MKSFFRAVSVLLLIVCCSAAASAAPKGHLVIIGGGTRPDNVMEKFIELAGGREVRYLVISNAGKGCGFQA